LVACAAALACGTAHGQTLVEVTERALPGDPINIVGDGLGGSAKPFACQVASDGSKGQAVGLETVSRSPGTILARIPAAFTPGVWQVWVQDGNRASNRVYVNHPDIFFHDQERVLRVAS
jgi:hypothetical protein